MSKFLSLLLIFFFYSFSGFGQDVTQALVQKAYPKEGLQAFNKKFIEDLKLPELPKGIYEVSIRLKFIVEKDGSFSEIQVLNDNLNIAEEVIQVFKQMPLWSPAVYEGKNVRSAFTLPIKIKVKDPVSNVFSNKNQKKFFIENLNLNTINTEFFDLKCNCSIAKSSRNDELLSEEFLLYTQDNTASYNIAFRKMDYNLVEKELEVIKNDAIKQKAVVKNVKFNGVKATEIHINIPNANSVENYRMLFFYYNQHIVALNVVSYNQQVTNILFEHLKENFKLKI